MRYILTASAFAAIANAQTWSLCNPMEKDCDNNPAIAKSFESNFKDGEGALKGWQQTAKGAEFTDEGIVFSVKKTGDAPTIQSDGYLHFGYVEVTMKAARGAGIVSSIVLESDDLDEVDWEFIGSDATHAQMNYFGKGNTTVYDRMIMADVPSIEEVHRYALNWTSDALTWLIDDAPVRTLNYADANGGKNFPQTPCNVRIGIWAGGDSKDKGTQDWAGGKVDYSQAPFNQVVEKVKITNYSPGKEYEWTDKSGSWESIKVIDGEGVSSGGSKDEPSTTEKPSEEGAAATSTPCTEEATMSTPPPEETPCDCEVETVTVTGPPPSTETSDVPQPPQTTPPPPETSDSPPPPESTTCTDSTTESVPPPPTTSDSPPPPESTSEVPPPPSSSEVPPPSTSDVPPESTPPPSPPTESTSEVPPPPPESTSCTESTTESVPTPPATSDSPPPPETTEESSTVPPSPPQTTPPTEESSSAPPPESTPCTESTETTPTPPATSDSPPPPATETTPAPETSSSVPPPEETPCTTTTTTEVPPPPPASSDNCTTLVSVTVPPYPITPTGGIIVDTSAAPSVPYPTNPTGAIPSPPNGTSPPIQEFPGAASTSTVSYLLAVAAGLMVFAL
ncbi:concanavalin A-like lectin/glucanase [Paraphaeosphaeria sporulosa]|uniref:chitinase n=1 Tax=Paraphaeosphaeria sporulosa TaxID=1460663 RepID=A0A177C5Q4_9PLEO|nr:concanavalin A-like lectin/glucanase [Paraphaeosphaeria sporulosa]OAG02481.1 concanavalin A-like lectin/glucanase [Paraphaeosphaeria sporulosa]